MFSNSRQQRNLADLITAKLAAHENKARFVEEEAKPRSAPLPPKVVEVYKKYLSLESNLMIGWEYYFHVTSLANCLKRSRSSRPHRIGRPSLC